MSRPEPLWRVFFALGDENRLIMLRRLVEMGPLPTLRLVAGLPFSRQAGAKHVDVLAEAGIVSVTKQGRERLVSLVPENIHLTQMYMAQLETAWNDRLGELVRFIDSEDPPPPG